MSNFIQVKFKRKNKEFIKNIYFYITKGMSKNLENSNKISQWFKDCTYYTIPRNNNQFKLFIIIGYNHEEKKTHLGALILIKNENIETFTAIFNYLDKNFGFKPKCINIDYCTAEIRAIRKISIRKIFPHTKIILCYYHIIKRIIKHLPQIRSKNDNIKNKAKDLFANIKILLFLNQSKLKIFVELIKDKFEKDFPALIKYFYINFFKKYPLNDLCWNYDLNFIFESKSIDDFFLTNIICESTNRLLNMHYYGVCKSIKNFEEAIKSLIKLYEDKNIYVEGKFSITRAIALYIRTEKIEDLIN